MSTHAEYKRPTALSSKSIWEPVRGFTSVPLTPQAPRTCVYGLMSFSRTWVRILRSRSST
jgi:hypothetical protein